MIAFTTKDPTDNFESSAQLIDYKDIKAGKLELLDSQSYVTKRQALSLTIDYPLASPAIVPITTEDPKGFTLLILFTKIVEEYTKIYEEEGAAPKPVGNLYNRPSTHGKYGIWGHAMEDLFLEGAEITKGGKVRLSMGS
jgi:hypothetical protein